jgi:hypothetical protein
VTLGQLVNGLVGKAIERVGIEPRQVLHQCELLRLAGKKGIGEDGQGILVVVPLVAQQAKPRVEDGCASLEVPSLAGAQGTEVAQVAIDVS